MGVFEAVKPPPILPNRLTSGQPFRVWLGKEFCLRFGRLHPFYLTYLYKYIYIIWGAAQQGAQVLRALQIKFGHLFWAIVRHLIELPTKYRAQPPVFGWALPRRLGGPDLLTL